MRQKRFLLHDPELNSEGRLVCRRCGASKTLGEQAGGDLYSAMEEIDVEPCAIVELDPQGMPQPVR